MEINPTPIIESVLKTAKMPTKGNVAQRNLLARNDVDKFYSHLKEESQGGNTILVDKFAEIFKKVFPGTEVRIEKLNVVGTLGGVATNLTDKAQVKGYRFLLGAINENNTISLDRRNIETVQHELSHLSEGIRNPKFQASKQSFFRKAVRDMLPKNELDNAKLTKMNTRARAYENIYGNFLYQQEMPEAEYEIFKESFRQGGKEKAEAVKNRLADLKENYQKRMKIFSPMVEDEKTIMIKSHIRRLQSEQKAYLSGAKYKADYNKSLQETPEFEQMKPYLKDYKTPQEQRMADIREAHMDYLFPEKIKMLKEMFFEEVQKSRAAHKAKLEGKK